jgi:uncharacterized metal-binding protein
MLQDLRAVAFSGGMPIVVARGGPMDLDTPDPAPYGCRTCRTRAAFVGPPARMPADCPTLIRADLATDVSGYLSDERQALMQAADAAPVTGDGRLRNRVEELVFFARARGMRRIGVAFCVSMLKEAQALSRILESEGLRADLACCRAGAVDPVEIGLPRAHPERFSAICNPVAQARLLDAQGADLIVQMGLCIGHDLILQQEARAPVTTLVVKDRVLDHQPIRALRAASTGGADATG